MRVMTFNLRMNTPNDGPNAWGHRLPIVQATIRTLSPDIMGTQEALPSMLSDLGKVLPEYSWVGVPRREGDESSAIFYNPASYTLLTTDTFWLSESPTVEGSVSWDSSLPRICTFAIFAGASKPSSRFAVFNTHLDHKGPIARQEGLRLILERMRSVRAEYGVDAMILMGDFNDHPASDVVRLAESTPILEDRPLVNSWRWMGLSGDGKTFHGFQGGRSGTPIDYIFATNTLPLTNVMISREEADGRFPSDHYPVVADFADPPNQS